MKTLACEMCNSTDLVKQDGVFVCQYCGTKYSVEEAKKLMIEGHVDVSGSTVKVDNSNKLNNLFQLARRAVQTNNNKAACQYYESILIEDPNSWEATLFSAYYKYLNADLSELESIANHMTKSLIFIVPQIKKTETADQTSQALNTTYKICNALSTLIYDEAKRNLQRQESQRPDTPTFTAALCLSDLIIKQEDEFIRNRYAAITIMYMFGNHVVAQFINNEKICKTYAVASWSKGIQMHTELIKKLDSKEEKENAKQEILKYTNRIRKYNPDYECPEINSNPINNLFKRMRKKGT